MTLMCLGGCFEILDFVVKVICKWDVDKAANSISSHSSISKNRETSHPTQDSHCSDQKLTTQPYLTHLSTLPILSKNVQLLLILGLHLSILFFLILILIQERTKQPTNPLPQLHRASLIKLERRHHCASQNARDRKTTHGRND
jgi:hypothetical protein